MSAARESLFENVKVIRGIVAEEYATDDGLAVSEHNKKARVVRNGLMVCLFNMLEQFLKHRFSELVIQLSGATIAYLDFPDGLKTLLSIKAIDGLSGFIRVSDRSSRLGIFDTHVGPLGGMNSNPPIFSHLGFGYERSNLHEGDLGGTLAAFGVEKSWNVMGAIAARSGISRASLKDDFLLIGRMRNRAAHNPSANIATSDLIMAADIVMAVAIGFDLATSAAVRTYCSLPNVLQIEQAIRSPVVRLRFIDQVGGQGWKEKAESARRYLRNHHNLAAAKAMALSRPTATRETVVVRSSSLIPVEWTS